MNFKTMMVQKKIVFQIKSIQFKAINNVKHTESKMIEYLIIHNKKQMHLGSICQILNNKHSLNKNKLKIIILLRIIQQTLRIKILKILKVRMMNIPKQMKIIWNN